MTLILDADDLVGVLDYPTAIDVVEGAFRDLGSGKVVMPVRLTIRVEAHEGVSTFMPAYLLGKDELGIKVVSAFVRNREIWPPDGYRFDTSPGRQEWNADGHRGRHLRDCRQNCGRECGGDEVHGSGRRVDAGDLRFRGPGGDPPPSDLRGAKVRWGSRKLA